MKECKFKLHFFNKIFSLLIIFLDIPKKHENITNNFKNTAWLILKSQIHLKGANAINITNSISVS